MESGAAKGLKAEINVTPLVDVVLVLLIIFMVVTPMLQKSKAVELPEAEKVERGGDSPSRVSLVIDHDGAIFLDGVPVETDLVGEMVRLRLDVSPGLEVVLKGDRRLEYHTVRDLMTSCRKAGAKRVVLATKEHHPQAGDP